MFLSVEGDSTEKDYFSHLNDFLDDAIIRVEVLRHRQGDGYSDPKHVIELLQEYINLREGEIIPKASFDELIKEYSADVIEAYLSCPDVDGALVGGASLKIESYTELLNNIK